MCQNPNMLYRSPGGRKLLLLLTNPKFSRIVGYFLDTFLSKLLIHPFITLNHLDLSDYRNECWLSFNAFFTRRIKPGRRPVNWSPKTLISPCDGLLTVCPMSSHAHFQIKGSVYSAASLLHDKKLAAQFCDGQCLIFRLTPSHYHRYCYPDDGYKTGNIHIPGILHTVQPVALECCKVYKANSREYTLLKTENFGTVLFMEIGAMMVGRICNYHSAGSCRRGQEKGRFEFGGSTIILFLSKGAATINPPILEASKEGKEFPVQLGMSIGRGI